MAEYDSKRLGPILKKARKSVGLTQAEVAKRLGITYQAVSNYERGINNIDSFTLFKLSDMYNLPLASLIEDIDYQVIAQKLKNARRSAGLTQQEVATNLNLSVNAIRKYESGTQEIDIDTIKRLCSLYKINVSSIISKKNVICYSKNAFYFTPLDNEDGKNKLKQHIDSLCKTVEDLKSLLLDDTPSDTKRAIHVEISIQATENFALAEWAEAYREGKASIEVTDNNNLAFVYNQK